MTACLAFDVDHVLFSVALQPGALTALRTFDQRHGLRRPGGAAIWQRCWALCDESGDR
jgi:hypothetical protein